VAFLSSSLLNRTRALLVTPSTFSTRLPRRELINTTAAIMNYDSFKTISWPTLDRPFGVELWPIFVKGYSNVMGYSPTDFKFAPGETPMSTLTATATMLISYYIVVFGGRELMKKREPFVLKYPFLVHNFYLTVISGVLLALFIEQLLPTVVRNGIFFSICNHKGGWTKELVMLYYVCASLDSTGSLTNSGS
jgi:hypothetical protein